MTPKQLELLRKLHPTEPAELTGYTGLQKQTLQGCVYHEWIRQTEDGKWVLTTRGYTARKEQEARDTARRLGRKPATVPKSAEPMWPDNVTVEYEPFETRREGRCCEVYANGEHVGTVKQAPDNPRVWQWKASDGKYEPTRYQLQYYAAAALIENWLERQPEWN